MNHPTSAPRNKPVLKDEEIDPALFDMSRQVISSSIDIHRALGPGLDKSVYDAALAQELRHHGMHFTTGHEFPVEYKGKQVGTHKVCFYIGERFVVRTVVMPHEVGGFERDQLRNQLKLADLELGLIINFGLKRLTDGLVRVINPDKIDSLRGGHGAGSASAPAGGNA